MSLNSQHRCIGNDHAVGAEVAGGDGSEHRRHFDYLVLMDYYKIVIVTIKCRIVCHPPLSIQHGCGLNAEPPSDNRLFRMSAKCMGNGLMAKTDANHAGS